MWLIRSKSLYDMLNWPLSSWLSFAAALLGLVVMIWMIVRLIARLNEDTDPAEARREMLLAITELRREGDLTKEEFRSIKSQLDKRSRVETECSSPPPPTADSAAENMVPTELDEEQ